jgi:hypothetical protein
MAHFCWWNMWFFSECEHISRYVSDLSCFVMCTRISILIQNLMISSRSYVIDCQYICSWTKSMFVRKCQSMNTLKLLVLDTRKADRRKRERTVHDNKVWPLSLFERDKQSIRATQKVTPSLRRIASHTQPPSFVHASSTPTQTASNSSSRTVQI